MITDNKNTDFFCTVNEFSKNFDSGLEKKPPLGLWKAASLLQGDHVRQRDYNRAADIPPRELQVLF